MKENQQLLVFLHLSQLLNAYSGFLGIIVPLVIWQTNKKLVFEMDAHGKAVMNFQISVFILVLCCIPLILFFGLGVIGIIILSIISIVFPVLNAIRAGNGTFPNYPLVYKFID